MHTLLQGFALVVGERVAGRRGHETQEEAACGAEGRPTAAVVARHKAPAQGTEAAPQAAPEPERGQQLASA